MKIKLAEAVDYVMDEILEYTKDLDHADEIDLRGAISMAIQSAAVVLKPKQKGKNEKRKRN